MRKKRVGLKITLVISLLILVSYFIPKETTPSPDTRVIIEHTKGTYIAPRCFEDSEPTNYLGDGTIAEAIELNYEIDSACTEKALEGVKDSLFISILKDIGVLSKKWDDW